MKNFIFISPNFPENYWHFCRELKNNGLNVLGIGDAPYDYLCPELKDSLNEYYKVGSLENYDEVCRAVDFFRNKYGEIDWLESNNEYWLERDARLRTDFNIKTGFHNEDMPKVKYKSRMKEFYARVGIPTARYHIVDSWENCMAFIQEVGYPVIVKPNNGVGASFTYKLNNQDEVAYFFATKFSHIEYIMEEYIYAEINSYDAIINSHGEPIFEIGNVTPMSIMDVVNNADNSIDDVDKVNFEELTETDKQIIKSRKYMCHEHVKDLIQSINKLINVELSNNRRAVDEIAVIMYVVQAITRDAINAISDAQKILELIKQKRP